MEVSKRVILLIDIFSCEKTRPGKVNQMCEVFSLLLFVVVSVYEASEDTKISVEKRIFELKLHWCLVLNKR